MIYIQTDRDGKPQLRSLGDQVVINTNDIETINSSINNINYTLAGKASYLYSDYPAGSTQYDFEFRNAYFAVITSNTQSGGTIQAGTFTDTFDIIFFSKNPSASSNYGVMYYFSNGVFKRYAVKETDDIKLTFTTAGTIWMAMN